MQRLENSTLTTEIFKPFVLFLILSYKAAKILQVFYSNRHFKK